MSVGKTGRGHAQLMLLGVCRGLETLPHIDDKKRPLPALWICGGMFWVWELGNKGSPFSPVQLQVISHRCKSKLQWGTFSHHRDWHTSQRSRTINAVRDVDRKKLLFTDGGNAFQASLCGKQYEDSSKKMGIELWYDLPWSDLIWSDMILLKKILKWLHGAAVSPFYRTLRIKLRCCL